MKTVFGTGEWSSSSENCISGCSHNCYYCYAKAMAIRMRRSCTAIGKIS